MTGAAMPAGMQGRWWEWAASAPEGDDPVSDPSGADCRRNQPGDVWFLAGTFGTSATRRCDAPAGRPVVVPIVNVFGGANDCSAFMATAQGSVDLDGSSLPIERIESEPISFVGVGGNALGTETERVDAVGCGLWATIPALPAGLHQLRVRGGSGDFEVSVDYRLQVLARTA
ncbi:MAG TPA: hypothetical protein VK659_03570 [Asanoa sp.]|nr:hypothetical protein [Asanoa sp.]